jgi:protein phosphatase
LVLLCSDGLTGELHDREIEELLSEHIASPERAARLLVRLAVDRGGSDNVTVVVLRV